MKRKDFNKGFTIVEVALVLAIAGLIFLMVFLVLPSVQRTQRDAKRRDDVGVLLTAIQKYQNNSRGALPEGEADMVVWDDNWDTTSGAPADNTWEGFYHSFLGKNFEDPAGYLYRLKTVECNNSGGAGADCTGYANYANNDVSFDGNDNDYKYTMFIVKSAACDGSKAVASGNLRKVAVLYKMEGTGAAYCANMQ